MKIKETIHLAPKTTLRIVFQLSRESNPINLAADETKITAPGMALGTLLLPENFFSRTALNVDMLHRDINRHYANRETSDTSEEEIDRYLELSAKLRHHVRQRYYRDVIKGFAEDEFLFKDSILFSDPMEDSDPLPVFEGRATLRLLLPAGALITRTGPETANVLVKNGEFIQTESLSFTHEFLDALESD